MKADALKLVAAASIAGIKPTNAEAREALAEAVDIALGFFADVRKVAVAIDRLADAIDRQTRIMENETRA